MVEILVCDQIPRNIYRGKPEAFQSDERAREALRFMLEKGWDKQLPPIRREFAYLPLEPSENMDDQIKSVELYTELGVDISLQFADQILLDHSLH